LRAEAVRLADLGRAIAVLTATDMLHVKSLDEPSWARSLQILEDVGPAWVEAVLHSPDVQNITTREALKNLLTAKDSGGSVPFSGGLDMLRRDTVKCFKCGMFGHFARIALVLGTTVCQVGPM
jgi:hypothetical protein